MDSMSTTNRPVMTKTVNDGSLSEIFDNMDDELSRLNNSIENLMNKLSPILKPEQEEATSPAPPEAEGQSDVGGKVYRMKRQVARSANEISSITRRIDL